MATRLAQEIAVDISTPVQISAAFLPDMVTAGKGFLINVASISGYTPTPRMAVYRAAKAFVLSFTESLWVETRTTGVTVFALSPGATSTEFNAVVGTDHATARARMRTPDDRHRPRSPGAAQPGPEHDRRLVEPSQRDRRPNDEPAQYRYDDASPGRSRPLQRH
ncbi:SDR family NAD(P)-dependent oxidoreductase [Arthrobacter zhaoxinii]|uniref:SDR family NAD(P)-dependent oxidoreductase n=1 Tax=Arthrobacter zhaoxinii TaxID=2964616 RepID=A0ABY5YT15_9MICC|nr:SDR family NAD(P)-dependent oxidoreductase [Arthrobacter zhaoxinii]UWX97366.1 SDR family NAD(P)-dependent oxidoreductase [Arthrobacter zhaoxinii]